MPKTVMIVDDYDDTRAMMKILLQCHGYDVVEAADGYEAVEKSVQFHPDLILMDLALPLMDGETATKIIRETAGCEKVSIVALTGYSNASFETVKESGFDNILIKPLHFENLAPILNQYLA